MGKKTKSVMQALNSAAVSNQKHKRKRNKS